MKEPNTGNQHLDHNLVWFRLMTEMAVAPAERSLEFRRLYRRTVLNMTIVTSGVIHQPGDYCVSACCALGTAALNPYFNLIGLSPARAPLSVRLSTMNVMLLGRSIMFTSPKLAALFGLPYDRYIRIVEPASYGKRSEGNPITAHDVMSVMREVMIETFEVDPLSHPYITGLRAA